VREKTHKEFGALQRLFAFANAPNVKREPTKLVAASQT
jgi:hypothetical protein